MRDIERSIAIYKTVFNFTLNRDDSGPNPVANFSDDMTGVSAHLYPDEPAIPRRGSTIYLIVPETPSKQPPIAAGQPKLR